MHVYEAALKMDVTPLSVYIYGFMTRTYGSSRVHDVLILPKFRQIQHQNSADLNVWPPTG